MIRNLVGHVAARTNGTNGVAFSDELIKGKEDGGTGNVELCRQTPGGRKPNSRGYPTGQNRLANSPIDLAVERLRQA
jgi:hypothetical protein